MRDKNIDKYAAVNVGGKDFEYVVALALRSAIDGTPTEIKAVRDFIKDHKAELSDRAVERLWQEMDRKGIPQDNSDYLTDIAVWIYRERERRQEEQR